MLDILLAVGSVIGYGLVGGLTFQITPDEGGDGFAPTLAGMLWPIGLPFLLGMKIKLPARKLLAKAKVIKE